MQGISIHALREEGDHEDFVQLEGAIISIHALREEGDERLQQVVGQPLRFLSTPSARRATERRTALLLRLPISIHALREEGDHPPVHHQGIRRGISIHALREEGDRRV